ncbi:hypothetical protein H5410_035842 [Solanum commersonii]|uniref:Uncharacterized protein n=1 Tax=Solanum commersonii TaxID=4109 RepID=A0A9J5Y3R4_SOLCO|nr:hypothetical protein H5410_035842 [Solanum commersonii]
MSEDKIVLPKDLVDMSQEPNNSPIESQDIRDKKESVKESIVPVEKIVEPGSKYVEGPGYPIKMGKGGKVLTSEEQDILGSILEVPCKGVGSVEGCVPYEVYVKDTIMVEDIRSSGIPKKYLKGEHQLYFVFVNKVLLPM